MAKADVAAGRAFVTIFMKDQLTKPLRNAKKELTDFGSSLLSIGAKVTAAGAAVAGGFVAAVAHFAKVGSELNDLSLRTGISTTALVELGHAAEMTGTDMETLEDGIQRMQRNLGGIGPDSKKARAALAAMGIDINRLKGLSPEDQFQAIAESIGSIEDPSQRAAAAMAIFGTSGTALLPMMQDIRALREEARELGLAPSPESIEAADALGDAIDRVRKVVGAAFFEIAAALAPMAMEFLNVFLGAAKGIRKFVSENQALIVTIAKVSIGVLAAGAAIMAIGAAFIGAGAAISGFLAVFSAVTATAGVLASVVGAILSPLGLLVVALVAGAFAWTQFTESGLEAMSGFADNVGAAIDWVKGRFASLASDVSTALGAIVKALTAGDIGLAAGILWALIKLEWQRGVAFLTEIWQTAKVSLLNTWDEINFKIGEAWINTVAFLSNAWQGFIDFAENAGRGFVDGFTESLKGMEGFGAGLVHGMTGGAVTPTPAPATKLGPTDPEVTRKKLEETEKARREALEELRRQHTAESDPKARERENAAQAEIDKAKADLEKAQEEFRSKASEADTLPDSGKPRFKKPGRTPDFESAGMFGESSGGKASAASFSAASLIGNALGAGGQLRATLDTKKAVENQTKQQKTSHQELLAALRIAGLFHA